MWRILQTVWPTSSATNAWGDIQPNVANVNVSQHTIWLFVFIAMLLAHIKIQYLELVCISRVAFLLQFPFQFHQKCKDSNAIAITSISVTRPKADECSEDYFNQDFLKLITKAGLKRVLIFFLINTISIGYGMQFERIDFTSWQERKFWKNIWHFELLRCVCSVFRYQVPFSFNSKLWQTLQMVWPTWQVQPMREWLYSQAWQM